ncbi:MULTISPECIES: bifunctional phosphopantothenoylcysteine decarboxylase/phosphopantothenate--cysteine ligase CoaBC [unclassified Guyparkeria]|uniref:bifunctional phosphopantothenoylcysteine decarboxylase/phosphopantothenate--cysteine ligase CoaBC n=1 Tax=unclassified Guyparkeria TaxID=2626246 RepID=UPI00073397B2|nr:MULTISPECIES: bifunctional phosphopantothenoylcysteine decarboxylase/phosphopantothenate--cysteine ligase CoaBC [unclassified Guyparkeria]KTG16647.1 phosphopantothenoylcysteine decarboxylase [Guyparkeria sp. XI15]OAE85681.1 phosphopantothenoylcysteine decarboxylase [Guyparkeria sp. WRN-7]
MNASSSSKQRILVGVSGGIAAYKAVTLVRRLVDAGAEVRVVMTESATRFVAPLTFQAVSGQPVRTTLLDAEAESGMDHIALARWAERIVIAPASADLMARLAAGMADDLLTTLCLASEAPVQLAPAMNRQMWAHPATQANRDVLVKRGVRLLGPDEGSQACGETGAGRMMEPEAIAATVLADAASGELVGQQVVVTAGGTREPIDPVRFIANRSSGRMGFALAAEAARRGADVTLVAGPSALPTPSGVSRVDVQTAAEMQAEVEAIETMDLFIGAAAVADYRVATPAGNKLKKQGETLSLELVRNPDILQGVAARDNRPFVIGFAAETERLAEHAEAKRRAKGMDLVCANRVGEHLGFDTPDNALLLLWEGGERDLPTADKTRLAGEVLDTYQQIRQEKHASR